MKKRTALLVFLVIAALVVFGLGLFFASAIGLASFGSGGVPDAVLLEADFEAGVIEYQPNDPIAGFLLEGATSTRDVVDALDQAAQDDRVKGLVAHVGSGAIGLAQAQELRDAILRFRGAGKPAYAWSETFGEVSPGNTAYYLASAFEKIYLQPSGDVWLTGLSFESLFYRGALDLLEISPRLGQRHEYKSAMNTFTETSYTEPHAEASSKVMNSIFDGMVLGIADARGLGEDAVRELIDGGPFLGQEAVDAGLVDGLAYRDEVYAAAREAVGESELLYLDSYLSREGRPNSSGERIALIYGVGAVMRGASGFDPLAGTQSMGSATVAAAFRDAIEDEGVRAIVFRVDSPGGSYVASDTIWRETVRAREAGKPVIVSMGNVAGSGGYFVAMSADKIVAQPATITGSIGVLGGKLVTTEAWAKAGLSWDHLKTSENAGIYSMTQDYTPSEWARFEAWLDRVYADFTEKVADGRGLPLETVQEIAKGRIWSGSDALEIGLVDELGGLDVALRLAREAAGLEADEDIAVELFPQPKSTWEQLFDEPASSSEPSASVLTEVLAQVRPLVRAAQRVGLLESAPKPLAMAEDLSQMR